MDGMHDLGGKQGFGRIAYPPVPHDESWEPLVRALWILGVRSGLYNMDEYRHAIERMAPVPFSVVCFRATPDRLRGDEAALDALNARVLERINKSGDVFLSHTKLNGKYVLRLAIGNGRTTEADVRRAWDVLNREAEA